MSNTTLFDHNAHSNVLLEDVSHGDMIQANQHLVIDDGHAMILDPGGHKVYNAVLSETFAVIGRGSLDYIFLSHQDPDIVAALNGWLMTTDAEAIAPAIWQRFIPHFGLDSLVQKRLTPVPDEGRWITLGNSELLILPAHFLHSCGNFHLYDPTSKILYTGDLGASVGQDYIEVTDFDAHLQFMEGFHRRYMASGRAMRAWVKMIRDLDIEIIAPQHGSLFRGGTLVSRFIEWCDGLECGIDLMESIYKVPPPL